MRYLLDTNVLAEHRKGPRRADSSVMAWMTRIPAADTALSVATIFETSRGIAMLQRRDSTQARHLQVWLDRNLESFRDRILPIDTAVMLAAGRLHAPDPRPAFDSLIAATALVHGLTVVTRNAKDFESMGVPVINPWEQT